MSSKSTTAKPTLDLEADVIATVLQLIRTTWPRVRPKITHSSSEPEIAGYLCREMLDEKKKRKLVFLRIEEEVGTRSGKKIVKPDGRIDLKIIYSFDEAEYFGIECKRVDSTSDLLAQKYVVEGILRFVSGKYSLGHEWGGMLAFVVDGQQRKTVKHIKKQVLALADVCRLSGSWLPEKRFPRMRHLYRTRHSQKSTIPNLSLLHLFLR